MKNTLYLKKDTFRLLFADDDKDDRLLFKIALSELPFPAELTTVNDGEQLMNHLSANSEQLPHVLFLDLNMPRKNGFECLSEIKHSEKLKQIPVIIFSTSYDLHTVNVLYKNGAQYYIRKPNEFEQLKRVIRHALIMTSEKEFLQPEKENFVLMDV